MNITLTANRASLAIACAVALSAFSVSSDAQTKAENTGYLTDQRGPVVRSGFGLCWHTSFGPAVNAPECDTMATPVKVAEAAQSVQSAPPPRVPSAKPAGAKVTLSADTLFDFDKAVLRPAGRSALDDFLEKLNGIEPEVIIAVGHADRFGSDSYNQSLSERRATAVKTYLVSKGVAGNRVHTEGKGEKQPVTKPGECNGAKSAKVIACLQPNRRVEIEVVGTRIER